MAELADLIGSCRFASTRLFWPVGVLLGLLVFLPLPWKRKGLAIDLGHWRRRLGLGNRVLWVRPALVALVSLLLAVAAANPQGVVKEHMPIMGKPVLAVVDVSSSMHYAASAEETMSGFEKARLIVEDLLDNNLGADIGLVLYSSENYVARYFAPKRDLLRDTLDNVQELKEISYGTRTAAGLALARRFLQEKVEGRDKAIVLISDLHGSPAAVAETNQEMERIVKAGIKLYVIAMGEAERAMRESEELGSASVQVKGVMVVSMNDAYGIDRIEERIGALASAPLREEEIIFKKSLLPYLVPPIVGLMILSLVLSETCFRRIP